jgi:hypothetical protein
VDSSPLWPVRDFHAKRADENHEKTHLFPTLSSLADCCANVVPCLECCANVVQCFRAVALSFPNGVEVLRSSFALTLFRACVVNSVRAEGIEIACSVLQIAWKAMDHFGSRTESEFVIFHLVLGFRVVNRLKRVRR